MSETVSYIVAECSEFHNMGELHEDVKIVEEAIKLFKEIPPERINGIPSIRISVSSEPDSDFPAEMDILTGNTIDLDMLSHIPQIAENTKAQQAIAELIHAMPEATIRGEVSEDISKRVQWIDAREKRNDELKGIMDTLEKGVQDVFASDDYKKLLTVMSKMPHYSVNNQILIMLQNPQASLCNSFTGWKKQNRFVKAGEKGLRILAPAFYQMEREQDKLDANGKVIRDKGGEPVKETVTITVNAFKLVSTFDISQTDGEPLPQLGVAELVGNIEGYGTLMQAIKDASPVPIGFEFIESGAKGYYHIEDHRIAIQDGMSEVQTVKTALHEIVHAKYHSIEAMEASGDKKSQAQKECEAESIAFVCASHYGLNTSDYSFGYVAGWSSGKEEPELKASLQTVKDGASEIINAIDKRIMELTAVKETVKEEPVVETPKVEQPEAKPEVTKPEKVEVKEKTKAEKKSVKD